MAEKKEVVVSEELKQKFEDQLKYFKEKCITGFRATAQGSIYGAFMACGVLKEAESHLMEKVNDIWLYGEAINQEGTDTVAAFDLKMTFPELLTLKKLIDVIVEKYQFFILKEKKDLEEILKEQEKKLRSGVDFKENEDQE